MSEIDNQMDRVDAQFHNRQLYLRKINRQLIVFMLGLLLLVAIFAYDVPSYLAQLLGISTDGDLVGDKPSFLVALVFVAGVIGGFVSMQQRLPNYSLVELRELAESRQSLIMMPVIGGIFAIVLLTMFAGNLITGAMFPEYSVLSTDSLDPKTSPGQILQHYLQNTFPKSSTDLAKLLFWSFVAGFVERFVPQLVSIKSNAKEETNPIVVESISSNERDSVRNEDASLVIRDNEIETESDSDQMTADAKA